jgi:NitT/TauT family transport system substrate-binding protein
MASVRRTAGTVWIALSVGLWGLLGLGGGAAAFAATDQVTLAVDWVIGGTHTPYFVALDKGFYAGSNLAVTITRGYGSGDTIKRVAAGRATFGVADMGALVAARGNDSVPVKAVLGVYGKAALGLLYLRESGIKGPKDLEGRTLGRSATGASVIMLPAFLKANAIDRQKIKEVIVDGTALLPLLIARKVDAVTEQSIIQPRFQKAADKEGLHVEAMRYTDHGLVTHGNAVMASETLIRDKPDLIRRFLQATVQGLAYAFDKPDEAVEIMQKYNREVETDFGKAELLIIKGLLAEEAKAKGLGYMSPATMTSTRDTVAQALELKRAVAVEELYTNEFLPTK